MIRMFRTKLTPRGGSVKLKILAPIIAMCAERLDSFLTPAVVLADPDHHREALTTRSLLLNAVARQTRPAGQMRLRVTSSHGRREHVKAALQSITEFFAGLKKTAKQLTDAERWVCILSQALQKYLRGRKLPPPILLPA
jgi:hypothetical protein